MKITTTSCLGLLMVIGSLATAQQITPPPSLPCSGPPTNGVIDWAQFRFGPCHTGFNPYESILSPAKVGNLVLKWSYATESEEVVSSPAVANGVVYIGSSNLDAPSNLYALNASTGALLWKYTTGDLIASSPAVVNGVVYFGSADYNVYALNASTGALLWKYTTGSYTDSSPAVADGVVYIGSDDGNVYALDAGTGTLLWKYATGFVSSSPAVANGMVYVGSYDNNVYALNASTGALLWKYTTGSYVSSSPAVVHGVVYVGSSDSNVYALNAGTGALLWKYTTGFIRSSPAVANGVVYVGSDDNNMYALDAGTGVLLWKYTAGNYVSSPAVANGVVYVGSDDNNVYALNASTGALLWKYTTGLVDFSSPAVVNGVVYIASLDGNLHAFHLPNLQLVTVTPCRLVDTRPEHGGGGPIQGGTSEDFPIPQEGGCNIPTTAAAYSLNVSVVPQGPLGYLTIWPTGENRPGVATLNSLDGRIKADAAIVPAGTNGAVSVYVTQTTNVILDINGYFAPGSTLAFYPLPPCRIADTRKDTFPPGLGPPFLTGLQEREFPVLEAASCNIPSTAAAYSLNFSVVPHGPLGYMTVWPTGEPRPLVSTLNDIPGTIIANAAIVPAGTGGEVSVYPSNDTDVIIDINGYFAPAGPGGLSLYPVAPCRVIDTRRLGGGQPFSGNLNPPVDVVNSPCEPPIAAQAYVLNATVVPFGVLGYLTLWPDGTTQPVVSTLNALDGSITNNMAIVPSTNGEVDAYASGITQLILDISSYFAP